MPSPPVLFGEVLYDIFEDDDTHVLGGAPFNVAWHLHGFGARPLFVSRVGEDADGRRVRETMTRWGMSDACLQADGERPTGQVRVHSTGSQVRYDIVPHQAYDAIDAGALSGCLGDAAPPLLYHGTLATREEASRGALDRLVEATGAPIFLDVNLRDPWWTQARVEAQMARARWLKLNDDEIERLTGMPTGTASEAMEAAAALQSRFSLQGVYVTRGSTGALVVRGDEVEQGRPPPVDVVDTVGAGDAFSAVAILGLLHDWDLRDTLDRALAFAAGVCRQRGATAAEPDLYERYGRGWGLPTL